MSAARPEWAEVMLWKARRETLAALEAGDTVQLVAVDDVEHTLEAELTSPPGDWIEVRVLGEPYVRRLNTEHWDVRPRRDVRS